MNFPFIPEITSTDVVSVSDRETFFDAVEKLFRSRHRHIVVESDGGYRVLSLFDVLKFSETIDISDSRILLSELSLPSIPTIDRRQQITEAIPLLREGTDLLAVVYEDQTLYGVVTEFDVLSSIDPDTLMENYRLTDILKIKKRNRWVASSVPLKEIFETMKSFEHDAALIVEERHPIGIITARDVLRLLREGVDMNAPISCYMSSPVETISCSATLNEALLFMKDKHFKRIVTVNQHGELVGSITQNELTSISYTRWVRLIQSYQEELHRTNEKLEAQNRKFAKIAATDPLTGLYNRMKFLELFISEYTVMAQRRNALSLLVIDLDHFKRVNDTYGHNTGDKVLKDISSLLIKELRNVDIVCRWGGEEFVALLPAADSDNAYKIAEKIRSAVESLDIDGIPKVTVSIGVSQIQEGDELQDVVERADKALYLAKTSGRNCVKKAE